MSYLMVFTTCPHQDEAEKLAQMIVKSGLGACVQLDKITSFYVWKGEVQREGEIRMTIKTGADNYAGLEKLINDNHSYELPQIYAVAVERGYKPYLKWVAASAAKNRAKTTPIC